jgi:hypothetical protein
MSKYLTLANFRFAQQAYQMQMRCLEDASFTQFGDRVCSCQTERDTTVYSVLRSFVNILYRRVTNTSLVSLQAGVCIDKSQRKCVPQATRQLKHQEDGNTSTSVITVFTVLVTLAGTSLN